MPYLGKTCVVLGCERTLQKETEIIERIAPSTGLVNHIRLQDCSRDWLARAVAIFDVAGEARSIRKALSSEPLQNLLLRIRARLQAAVDLHHEAIAEVDAGIVLWRRPWHGSAQIGTIAAQNAAERSRVRPGKFTAQSANSLPP